MKHFIILCLFVSVIIMAGCETYTSKEGEEFHIHNLVVYEIDDEECASHYETGEDILWNCDHTIADTDSIPVNKLLLMDIHLTDTENKAAVIHSEISRDGVLVSQLVASLNKANVDFPDQYPVAVLAYFVEEGLYLNDVWFYGTDNDVTPVYSMELNVITPMKTVK